MKAGGDSEPEAEGGAGPTFSTRTVLWLVLIGVFAFSAFTVLSAYAPDLRRGSDGGAHALSTSAVGFAGAARLLRARGHETVISRGADRSLDEHAGLLILTPTGKLTDKELEAFDFGGSILLVLPKWNTRPDPLHPGWVKKAGLLPPKRSLAAVEALSTGATVARRKGIASPRLSAGEAGFPAGADLRPGPITSLQTLQGGGWIPALVDEQGRTVVAWGGKLKGERNLYVLADPDLLNNHGLARLETAKATIGMLDVIGARRGAVVFDVTLAGFKRSRSMLKLAFEPPFLAATLCAAAAAALMGWQAFARFGAVRREERAFALGKQALADNSAGLIRMARREHEMAPGYALLIEEAAARAVGAPRALNREALAALLDRLGAAAGTTDRFTELNETAARAADRSALMRAARRLHQWRGEITREGH